MPCTDIKDVNQGGQLGLGCLLLEVSQIRGTCMAGINFHTCFTGTSSGFRTGLSCPDPCPNSSSLSHDFSFMSSESWEFNDGDI